MSARRAELLRIAAELFARDGYANVTVDDIGAAAGVSGPALYHHFTSKEALLGEMLVDISEHLLAQGRAVAATGGDVLAALVRFHARFAVDDSALITVQYRDLVHASSADRSRVTTLQSRYVALWVDEVRRRWPAVDRRRAQSAVHATFGLLNSTPHSGRLAAAEMVELLASMADQALCAAAASLPVPGMEK